MQSLPPLCSGAIPCEPGNAKAVGCHASGDKYNSSVFTLPNNKNLLGAGCGAERAVGRFFRRVYLPVVLASPNLS